MNLLKSLNNLYSIYEKDKYSELFDKIEESLIKSKNSLNFLNEIQFTYVLRVFN